jgi:hypothetical protein
VPLDRGAAATQPTDRENWILDLGSVQTVETPAQPEIRPQNQPRFGPQPNNRPGYPRKSK